MLIVIKNAQSARHGSRVSAQAVERVIAGRGEVIETRSLQELAEVAPRIAAQRPSQLVLWGGDGTVTSTLSAIGAAYEAQGELQLVPPIAFLPGGTMNIVSRVFGVRGRPLEALERLVRGLDRGAPIREVRRTAIRCGGRLGFLFGIGLIPNFHEVYQQGGQGGTQRALTVLGRATADAFRGGAMARQLFVPFVARITVDGAPFAEGTWTNVSAGGIEELGFGFRPYPRAAERDGGFHVVAHRLSPIQAVLELPRVRLGFGIKRATQGVASRVAVETERPLRWGFDGDTFEPTDRFELEGGVIVRALVP